MLQKSQLGMFRSLLRQIYRRSMIARDMILKIFEEKLKAGGKPGEAWSWQINEVETLLFNTIAAASQQTEIYIVIDALDEAMDENTDFDKTAQRLISYFQRLIAHTAEMNGRLKICISCRHYPNVNVGSALRIVVEDENEETLQSFILDRLSSNVIDWRDQSGETCMELVRMVVRKANRQFLWASIRIPMIVEGLNDGTHSYSTIYEVLETESSILSELYESILTTIVSVKIRPISYIVLQWIALADRPLSVAELRCALASNNSKFINNESLDVDDGEDARIEKLVRSCSGGLAVTRHEEGARDCVTTIRFIHQTIYEFVRKIGLTLLHNAYQLDADTDELNHLQVLAVCEERISRTCLNYWTSNCVVECMEIWEQGDERLYPFLEYSITKWASHASRSERYGQSQANLVEFFDSRSHHLQLYSKVAENLLPIMAVRSSYERL